jgi:hypothetical protein
MKTFLGSQERTLGIVLKHKQGVKRAAMPSGSIIKLYAINWWNIIILSAPYLTD